MFDDEDEYLDREPMPESPGIQAAAVAFGLAMLVAAIWWGV